MPVPMHMHIAMLMSVYGEHAIGGAERTAAQVAMALGERGHTVRLLSLAAPHSATANVQGQTMAPTVFSHTIPLVQSYDPYDLAGDEARANHAPRVKPSTLARAWWHVRDVYNPAMVRATEDLLAQLHHARPIDVLLTHTLQGFSVGVWAVAKRLGIALVHMTHDHALICPGTAMTRGAQACTRVCTQCRCFSWARHAVAATPHAVVGPSRVILERHQQFGWFKDVARQVVIPNALPQDWPSMNSHELADHVARAQQVLHFGFLGRIDESKGADTLIQALAYLPSRYLGRWQLHMGGAGDSAQWPTWYAQAPKDESAADEGSKGEGYEGPAQLAWAQLAPYVLAHGLVRADTFLQQLHVLITPSRAHETFCNVVMEATSLGRPAIVSDRGALPERISHGAAGWMFAAGEARALAVQMQALLDDPKRLIPKAQAALAMRAQYSATLQTTRFESLLAEVVRTNR